MKKNLLILFLLIMSGAVSAQTFWSESFSTSCFARGNVASGYTGTNGAWTIASTGTNLSYGNQWYVNDRISYNGTGNCAKGNDISCQNATDNSLHIGGMAIPALNFVADTASYWTGFYCQFGYCATTNKRAESPVINCTGKSDIGMNCVFYEGGATTNGQPNGDATLWYYDGSTWSKISEMVKTPRTCSGTMYGVFTSFAISLPVSANNNPNVKIGFNWTNDDVSTGSDPSFAVDNIEMISGFSNIGIEERNEALVSVFPNPVKDRLTVEGLQLTVESVVIYNTLGDKISEQSIGTHKQEMNIDVSKLVPGIYFVRLKAESGDVVKRFVKE